MSDFDCSTASKTCSTCRESKPLEDFSKKSKAKDGLNVQCKACVRSYNKRYYTDNREAMLERAKRWALAHPADDDRRARNRLWWASNKEKISIRRKAQYAEDGLLREQNKNRAGAWYKQNKDRQSKYNKDRYAANPDAAKARVRAYEAANPEKARAAYRVKSNKRRARLSVGEQYSLSDVKRLMILQRGRCANCGVSIKKKFHIDHRTPVAKGGNNSPHNIELLCPPCNLKKSAKLPHEFAQENGRLI